MLSSSFRRRSLAGCLVAATWAQAHAQSAAPPQPPTPARSETKTIRPDPLNAQAEVPPAVYPSAFAGYRAVGDAQVGAWKEANDTVTRIGGWRAYAREATAPAPTVVAPVPAAAASRSPAGHQHGHGKP